MVGTNIEDLSRPWTLTSGLSPRTSTVLATLSSSRRVVVPVTVHPLSCAHCYENGRKDGAAAHPANVPFITNTKRLGADVAMLGSASADYQQANFRECVFRNCLKSL